MISVKITYKNKIITFWIYICRIFNIMKSEKSSIVKSTRGGRLYVETKDFLLQDRVKAIIATLMDSDVVKRIDKRQREQFVKR